MLEHYLLNEHFHLLLRDFPSARFSEPDASQYYGHRPLHISMALLDSGTILLEFEHDFLFEFVKVPFLRRSVSRAPEFV